MAWRMDRHSIPNTYYTDGIGISKEFAVAFWKGCGGKLYREKNMLRSGDVAMFGDIATWHMLQQAIKERRNWFYGDKAYFGRGMYYRITKNALQSDCVGNTDPTRWNKLKKQIKPWKTGSKILICQQSEAFYRLNGIDRQQWLKKTIETIVNHSDRPIVIRSKVMGDNTESLFEDSLDDIHSVVVYTSVAGVQAAINGIPCFATHDCASMKFGSGDLSLIENPVKPDNREEMACVLANSQWTLDEIRNGTAWRMLNESLE